MKKHTFMSKINPKKVAVLVTCYNRREKTKSCLERVFVQQLDSDVEMSVILVDDGSTDGTSEMVASNYPQVKLIQSEGNLFWAGGMRLAWSRALLEDDFGFFWLINDDTDLFPTALNDLLQADAYAIKTFGKSGIYTGSTKDPNTGLRSYGGEQLLNPKKYASCPVVPNGTYQTCEFTNANCLLVPKPVMDQIGMFSTNYTHSIADFDYSMKAVRSHLPVLVLPDYVGYCVDDHIQFENHDFPNLKSRIRYLFHPKGFSYREFLVFVRRFFPNQYAITVMSFWLRTLLPSVWKRMKSN